MVAIHKFPLRVNTIEKGLPVYGEKVAVGDGSGEEMTVGSGDGVNVRKGIGAGGGRVDVAIS
jgi:hypothetical protein